MHGLFDEKPAFLPAPPMHARPRRKDEKAVKRYEIPSRLGVKHGCNGSCQDSNQPQHCAKSLRLMVAAAFHRHFFEINRVPDRYDISPDVRQMAGEGNEDLGHRGIKYVWVLADRWATPSCPRSLRPTCRFLHRARSGGMRPWLMPQRSPGMMCACCRTRWPPIFARTAGRRVAGMLRSRR